MAEYNARQSRVEVTKSYTKDHVEGIAERLKDVIEGASEQSQQLRIVNGIPVTIGVHAFVTALSAKHPEYTYGINNDCSAEYEFGFRIFSELCVYVEGDAYIHGRVGYRYYGTKKYDKVGPDDYMYGVYSRKIENEKYKNLRWQYHTKSSKILKTTLKFAETYVVPYSPEEVAVRSMDTFFNKMSNESSEAYNKRAFRQADLNIESIEWAMEFKNMRSTGYEFINPALVSRIDEYIVAFDEYREHVGRKISGWNVQTALPKPNDNGNTYVHIVCYHNIGHAKKPTLTRRIMLDALPLEVYGKLATLMQVANGGYVAGIGYRVSDDNYWVMTNEVLL